MVSPEIIFARHGNTFAGNDRVVWVGRETDLPLVERGRQQAVEAAQALRDSGLLPDVIFAAGLQRTHQFAAIIADSLGLPAPIVDPRLDEVDYGAWAGKSNDEIAALDATAPAALAAWNEADVWPFTAGWGSHWTDIAAALEGFVADHLQGGRWHRPLVVSSNGILRFLPRLVLPSPLPAAGQARQSFKMRTGHLGLLVTAAGAPHIVWWDRAPNSF